MYIYIYTYPEITYPNLADRNHFFICLYTNVKPAEFVYGFVVLYSGDNYVVIPGTDPKPGIHQQCRDWHRKCMRGVA